MTTIRANCPECGDVQLKVGDLTVRVCADDEQGAYTFRCPSCTTVVVKDASRRIIDLLVSSGVELQVWRVPAEITEAHYAGPAISSDDLLAFHELLESDHWFTDLVEMVRPEPSQ
jgi:rRNA maturation protein Nop10